MRYYFQWDHSKARSNLQKHKVSFKRAAVVFRDPNAVSVFDESHSIEEDRWVTIGVDESGILLVVIHTFTEETPSKNTIRIISARKAAGRERQQYEDQGI